MGFSGFPAEALEFYEGLEADNSKTYWTANKATYDDCVRGPMDALLADLAPRWGAAKVFRPYRDIRFSADKTPYKTHIGATLEGGGYIQLGSDGLAAGVGIWHMESDQLQRFRDAVADDKSGAAVETLMKTLSRKGIDVISREQLKTVPRGFDRDHPRADLLRYKGFAAWRNWPVEPWLGTVKARENVEKFFEAAAPLRDWLRQHVG